MARRRRIGRGRQRIVLSSPKEHPSFETSFSLFLPGALRKFLASFPLLQNMNGGSWTHRVQKALQTVENVCGDCHLCYTFDLYILRITTGVRQIFDRI